MILARTKEFFREPEVIFWVYMFPVLLAVCLGIAFRSKPAQTVHVLLEDSGTAGPRPSAVLDPLAAKEALSADPRFKVAVKPPEECRRDLLLGRTDIVVIPGEPAVYSFDPQRPESEVARQWVDAALQRAAGRRDPLKSEDRIVSEPGSRYIDFLIPGLLGMNIMGGGLWGVGFVMVDMRVRKLLKRFLATPMRKRDFLFSIVGSRMLFLVPEIVLLLLVGCLGFGVPVRGSLLSVAAIVVLSALTFSGLGLLIASRAQKIETISGLMNVVMLPMWILSGIFFSAERFPDQLQPLIQALRLTATIDSLRAVMLEGRSLASQGHELLILCAWAVPSFPLSLKFFRWL